MLIQAQFYYLIDTEPTVHPKHIHTGTIHTMLQEWKVFPLWEIILSWREKVIIPLPITTTCSSPALKRAMKAFPWLLETISKAKFKMRLRREWYGEGRNDNSCIFTHCVSYLPLFGSCLCRSKCLPTDTLSVYSVSMTPLSEHEAASAVCQPVLVIRVMPASLPPL